MAESIFIRADEVIRLLGISKSEAYKISKRLNDQMAAQGYIVVNGCVNRRYLEEQIYGYEPERRQGGKYKWLFTKLTTVHGKHHRYPHSLTFSMISQKIPWSFSACSMSLVQKSSQRRN